MDEKDPATVVIGLADSVIKRYEAAAEEALKAGHLALTQAEEWKARALKAEEELATLAEQSRKLGTYWEYRSLP